MTPERARPVRIAIVGVGKIARDQHLPTLANNPHFRLIAAASHAGEVAGVPNFPDVRALLAGAPATEAVIICTPPRGRQALVRTALEAGLHVMIEKPPGSTVGEVQTSIALAERLGLALFAAWHSREAEGVEPARQWLASREIRSVRVNWLENVRVLHPGQDWILAAGGLGVFDAGINALSILTRILPGSLVLEESQLDIPENRAAPIAAHLQLRHAGVAPVAIEFDCLTAGELRWEIDVDTDEGTVRLARGGATLAIDNAPPLVAPDREYSRLYARFRSLIELRRCDVDLTPLQLVADAFLLGHRVTMPAFHF